MKIRILLINISYTITNIFVPYVNLSTIYSSPISSRPKDVFLLSKIFATKNIYDEDESTISEQIRYILDNQYKLFKFLNINKFTWDNSTYFTKYKNKLAEWEDYYSQSPSDESINEFDLFQQLNHFDNINELELEIKNRLGNDYFTFTDLTNGKKEITSEIIKFYNFILNAKILDTKTWLQTIYEFKIENEYLEKMNASGFAIGEFYENDFIIMISFIKKIFDLNTAKREFDLGWSTNSHAFNTFIHEIAHAIFYTYNLGPLKKQTLNLNILRPKDASSSQKIVNFHFHTKFGKDIKILKANHNRAVYVALNFIYDKFDLTGSKDEIMLKLAKWTAVPGMYGRTPAEDDDEDDDYGVAHHVDSEWLTEAFTYYYLTPKNERTKIWQWWHEFFTKKLPQYL